MSFISTIKYINLYRHEFEPFYLKAASQLFIFFKSLFINVLIGLLLHKKNFEKKEGSKKEGYSKKKKKILTGSFAVLQTHLATLTYL